jgi:hypothetical protein
MELKSMDYEPDVFVTQFPVVKRFVYHLVYSRVFREAYVKHGVQCEFWTHTIDAHLLQAAICWSMVFGADGVNATHWTKLSKSEAEDLEKSFQGSLERALEVRWRDWKRYRKKVTEFRNKFAAHRDLDFANPVPQFDLALQTAFYYDEWIRQIISPDRFEEPPLKESAALLQERAAALAEVLIKITPKNGTDEQRDAGSTLDS